MTSLEKRNPKDYAYYAEQVNLCWSRAVAGIVAMGYLLCEARMNLEPLEWKRLIVEDCPFDLTVACRLMRIAQDQRVTDPEVARSLPPSWDKVYQLVTLPEPVFRQGLEEGRIRPEMTGKDVAELKALAKPEPARTHAPVDRIEELRARLAGVLRAFPFVESITARISDPKSQVIEIRREAC